jgi:hypothetical protein
MKNMKTKSEDIELSALYAKGNTIAEEVKREITFLWAEADEWKPTREAPEIMEDTNFQIP